MVTRAMGNPFFYGNPIDDRRPEAFADREGALGTLTRSMLDGRSVILMAPRRYGKTSLLYQALAEVRSRGARTGRVSVGDVASPRDAAEVLLTGILAGPARWRERQEEAIRDRLARMRPGLDLSPDGAVRFHLQGARDARSWRELLRECVRVLGDAAALGPGPVSLVIDEFQRLHEIDDGLPAVFKGVADELTDVSLVLCGSRRHLMDQLARGAAPLARIGTKVTLSKIARPVMVDFLQQRSTQGGKMLDQDVAERIHDEADGIPNEVQQLAYWSFAQAGRRIRTTDVAGALERVVGQNRFEFIAVFRAASPAQQRLLRLLAQRRLPSLHSREVVDQLEVANGSAVAWAARRLEAEDVIEQAEDGWRISNPFFARWLGGEE